MFQMRLFREQQDDFYFGNDVEMPLYMTEIDEYASSSYSLSLNSSFK
jgi:hypothetical protein